MRELFGLEGKSFLVVGGGQGMGSSTVHRLASLGANVAVLDVDQGRAEASAAEADAAGVRSAAIVADVLDDDQITGAVAEAEARVGPLSGMAAIVGMAGWSTLLEMTPQMWDNDQHRNLRYFFLVAQAVARRLVARGAPGSIVGVCSVDGMRSAPSHASYGAAKAGLMNLARSMTMEWAERGIRVNLVAPGAIVTPRIPLRDPEAERQSSKIIPMGRRGTTDEIANAITFFLSDMSSYVSGQTLAVDGGYLAAGLFPTPEVASAGAVLGVNADK